MKQTEFSSNNIVPQMVSDIKEDRHFKFKLVSTKELRNRPPVEFLVEGIMYPNDVGLLAADSASGKTFVALDFMYACATQGKFANKFQVNKKISAIYAYGEGSGGIAKRIKAVEEKFGYDDDKHGKISLLHNVPNLCENINVRMFIEDIQNQEFTPDLIIIDTLHNASTGHNDSDNRDMGVLMGNCKIIRDLFNCMILIVHHNGKSGETFRGAGCLMADSDFFLGINNKSKKALTFDKIKDAERPSDIEFKLVEQSESMIVDWASKTVYSPTQKKHFQEIITVLQPLKEKWLSVAEISKLVADNNDEESTQPHKVKMAKYLKMLHKDGVILSKSENSLDNGKSMDVYKYTKNLY